MKTKIFNKRFILACILLLIILGATTAIALTYFNDANRSRAALDEGSVEILLEGETDAQTSIIETEVETNDNETTEEELVATEETDTVSSTDTRIGETITTVNPDTIVEELQVGWIELTLQGAETARTGIHNTYSVIYAPGTQGTWDVDAETYVELRYGVGTPEFTGDLEKNHNSGYTFKGWKKNGVDSDISPIVEGNTVYEAQWEIEVYILIFDANGGAPTPLTQLVEYGSKATEPNDPSKDGYIFDGWYKEQTLENEWKFDEDTMPDHNVTLYAKWLPEVVYYTLSFDATGGTPIPASQTIERGSKAIKPANPFKVGFTFGGWYNEPTLENEWKFDEDTMPNHDVTLYAKWVEIKIIVAYESGEHKVFERQEYNELHYGDLTPKAPQVQGEKDWIFMGWSPVVSPIVTENVIYVAQWERNLVIDLLT